MRRNDANNMTHTPYYMRHFKIFDKMYKFYKNVSNVIFWADYSFWLQEFIQLQIQRAYKRTINHFL